MSNLHRSSSSRRGWEAAIALIVLFVFLFGGPLIVPCDAPNGGLHGPCERLLPGVIAMAAIMMIIRVVFPYNKLVDSAAAGSPALLGQVMLVIVLVGAGAAFACDWFGHLVIAELVLVACELCLILIMAHISTFGDRRLRHGMLHEILNLLVLIWIAYTSLCPAWQAHPWTVAPMILSAVVFTHISYVADAVADWWSKRLAPQRWSCNVRCSEGDLSRQIIRFPAGKKKLLASLKWRLTGQKRVPSCQKRCRSHCIIRT